MLIHYWHQISYVLCKFHKKLYQIFPDISVQQSWLLNFWPVYHNMVAVFHEITDFQIVRHRFGILHNLILYFKIAP